MMKMSHRNTEENRCCILQILSHAMALTGKNRKTVLCGFQHSSVDAFRIMKSSILVNLKNTKSKYLLFKSLARAVNALGFNGKV